MRKALSVLLLVVASLSVSNCTKNYPTTYVYDTVKTQARNVTVHISYTASTTSDLQITSNGNIVFTAPPAFVPDFIFVPDSSILVALWYSGNTAMTADTIASPGLVWNIH